MVNDNELNDEWGYAYKCGGIPMYPGEFHFHIDEPVEFSEEHVKARRKKLSKFLDKYGLKLIDEE